ncbi:restriction endonuclease subunit M [Kribbella monticola]|uniref:restriction endonuclease subunit M n=1 Tax=Kribbella monticola TaxID=2185285 RepID=UPI000DD2BAAB|nr:restriction endonuclease subunit M [Kribbella monticola]
MAKRALRKGNETAPRNVIGEWLTKALADGKATLFQEGAKSRIRYEAVGLVENFDDPEEWVRADFWAQLIYQYDYPEERIAIEVPVPDRVPGDYVDLAVCRDDARTNPYIIIECKRDDVTAAEFEQAVEQAVGNGTWSKLRADYVMVVAGLTRRVLDVKNYAIGERSKNVIADLPVQYGTPADHRFHKGGPIDIEAVAREEMIATLRKCHDTLWGGGKLSPPQAFGELCKLLYIKIADELKPRKPGDPYDFQVRTRETPKQLSERMTRLYNEHRRKSPDILNSELIVEPSTMMLLVEHMQSTSFAGTDVDVKGLAFEMFMDSFFKGDFGQYFTPRELIKFSVDLLDVDSTDMVCDPASGSGGFLLHALERVREKADDYYTPGSAENYAMWHGFATNNLFGIEINEEIARVAKMNMVLHGDGHTNIVRHDALDDEKALRRLNKAFAFNNFDLVLTNPPFGAKIRLDERPFLAGFVLGNTWNRRGKGTPRKRQSSEIVFIERVWQLLKPGTGRAAVVLPDGILTNSRTGYVREFIFDRFEVLAVVSLPVAAFMHYGAGVKASIVFLRKLGDTEEPVNDKPFFLAEATLVGYDATGREGPNQLPEILEAYRKFVDDPAPFVVEIPSLGGQATAAEDEDFEDE